MVLDNYRSTLDWWLVPLAKVFRNVHPDVFTWLSLLMAVLGGLAFWRSSASPPGLQLLLWAWVCVGLNSILDLMDGKVAHMTGKATARGDFLDHAVDRFSDAAFILGISFSPWADPAIGLVALAGTLLTSYMGTQAQAVGLKRHYGGLLGRADRMVLLLAVPLVQAFWSAATHGSPLRVLGLDTTWLGLLLAYFAVVGAFTTVQRFAGTLRSFGPDGRVP
ncbi:MAG TPA: CDP-alcohol phosphatidyltransferase family protein [Candidatus Thermoplasmatota archaeon]|nr:CDP-alcohol phosphatidyltransferase family protein [Candidatus Thermoplasmatota archaeon]